VREEFVSRIVGACAFDCDHRQAKILAPSKMPATSPELLDWKVRDLILLQDLQGFLLSGGSNRRNEIKYDRYRPVIEGLKREYPHLRIAVRTELIDRARAQALASAGIDTAMMDVIGAPEMIRDVYHLDRPVVDFETSLDALCGPRWSSCPTSLSDCTTVGSSGSARARKV
jgi:lipoyl synthase